MSEMKEMAAEKSPEERGPFMSKWKQMQNLAPRGLGPVPRAHPPPCLPHPRAGTSLLTSNVIIIPTFINMH